MSAVATARKAPVRTRPKPPTKAEAAITILDACQDPQLFGAWFQDRETWAAWFAFLAAMFGLPLSADQLAIYQRCTGRETPPPGGAREAWLPIGRRGGKSMILALTAVYVACFRNWRPFLAPGERATVMVIATDKKAARAIWRYAHALLTQVPLLKPLVERETAETIDLSNQVTIEILTGNFRTVRGYTIAAALLDEIAFWHNDDSTNPDDEIVAALRPAMATVPGSLLLAASSPYAKRGVLWKAYRKHYAKDGPVLVWKADTRTMNPTMPQSVIDEAYADDPSRAGSEYGAEFRQDIEAFLSREAVDLATIPERIELPPLRGVSYVAFVDPSGGSADSMTLAIAHDEHGRAVLDAVRERRPPFSPEDVTQEFAELLTAYRLSGVYGDRYAGEWPRERFRTHGIDYWISEKPTSEIYRDFLPIMNSGKAELLDLPRLAAQLCGLERRTSRGGRDTISHSPGAHDDVANAVAGAIVNVLANKEYYREFNFG